MFLPTLFLSRTSIYLFIYPVPLLILLPVSYIIYLMSCFVGEIILYTYIIWTIYMACDMNPKERENI